MLVQLCRGGLRPVGGTAGHRRRSGSGGNPAQREQVAYRALDSAVCCC